VQLSFYAACLLYALVLCWQTSEIPTEFAEGSYISLSILCYFQVALITIPLRWMVYETPDVSFFVDCAALFLSSYTVWLLIFLPKMWRIATGNDQLPTLRATGRSNAAYSIPTNFSNLTDNRTQPAGVVPIATPTHPAEERLEGASCYSKFPHTSRNDAELGYVGTDKSRFDGKEGPQMVAHEGAMVTNDGPGAGAVNLAGALSHLRANLDAECKSLSSSEEFLSQPESAFTGVEEELAGLAEEIIRARQLRLAAFASVGETAPEMATKSKPTGLLQTEENNAGVPGVQNAIQEVADSPGMPPKPQDPPEMDRSVSSINGEDGAVFVATGCPRQSFKRQNSPDVDSSFSSSTNGDCDPNGVVATAGGRPERPFKRQDSPDVDSSMSSTHGDDPNGASMVAAVASPSLSCKQQDSSDVDSSVSSTNGDEDPNGRVAKGGGRPRQSFKRKDSPDVDTSEASTNGDDDQVGAVTLAGNGSKQFFKRHDSSDIESGVSGCNNGDNDAIGGTAAALLVNGMPCDTAEPETNPLAGVPCRNPQEGSNGSHDESRQGAQEALTPGITQQMESESVSTTASTAATSCAAIFRKPPPPASADNSTAPSNSPIRLKKDPHEYGKSAALALGITKARSSFLRKVVASFGSTSAYSELNSSAPMAIKIKHMESHQEEPLLDGGADPSSAAIQSIADFSIHRLSKPKDAALKTSASDKDATTVSMNPDETTNAASEPS
jgi:7 transmembrane sweet-taste receptor of 3 GCPR